MSVETEFIDRCVESFSNYFQISKMDCLSGLLAKKVLQTCLQQLANSGEISVETITDGLIFSAWDRFRQQWHQMENVWSDDGMVWIDTLVSANPLFGLADGNPFETVYIWLDEYWQEIKDNGVVICAE